MDWSHFGAKTNLLDAICQFGFGFKFTADVSRDQGDRDCGKTKAED